MMCRRKPERATRDFGLGRTGKAGITMGRPSPAIDSLHPGFRGGSQGIHPITSHRTRRHSGSLASVCEWRRCMKRNISTC